MAFKLLTESYKKTVHRKLKCPLFFNLDLIVELFTVFMFNLKRFRNAQFYENDFKLFWQVWLILRLQWRFYWEGLNVLKVQNFKRIFISCFDKVEWFSQEIIFYTQFSIIFIMIKHLFQNYSVPIYLNRHRYM